MTRTQKAAGALTTLIVLLPLILFPRSVQGQTYTVLYNFAGARDGAYPVGISLGTGGTLYGAASRGGGLDFGTVWKLSEKNGSWIFTPLYEFAGGNDGMSPLAPVVIGPNGSLYGTTRNGGGSGCVNEGCGIVFNLRPPPTRPPTPLAPWGETVLYRFQGGTDGAYPLNGSLVFDQAGSLYGTTNEGGNECPSEATCGTVYRLTPSGGSYTEEVLYRFTGGSDGYFPDGSVVLDPAGNVYTTASDGGSGFGYGTVIQLISDGSQWAETTVYQFMLSDGAYPETGLTIDTFGNLYGGTTFTPSGGATVFKLVPSGGNWTFDLLQSLPRGGVNSNLLMDTAGKLYGESYGGGANGYGCVFELAPTDGGWIYTDLHDFNASEGEFPDGNLALDSNRNLYGTALQGGMHGYGVVFKIAL